MRIGNNDIEPPLPEEIKIIHDIPAAVETHWQKLSERVLKLTVSARMLDSSEKFVSGELALAFAGDQLPRITVPYSARVID